MKRLLSFAAVAVLCIGLAGTADAAGVWKANFNGSDQGTCLVHITASGRLSGRCHEHNEGQTFPVYGLVKGPIVRFGSAGTGAQFRGVIHGLVGHGTWENVGSSGKWVVRKIH